MNNQYSSLPHTNDNIGGGVGTRVPFFNNNNNNNGTNTNPNANPNNRNYGKKFNGKNKNQRNNYKPNANNLNNNPNNSAPRQPFNNYNSFNPDFSGCSLPHTQVNNNNNFNRNGMPYKFNKVDLNTFGNNVPVIPNHNKKFNKRRGGGSNNNYYGTGSFADSITDRLNKSLNKEGSLDSSFGELENGMPTSHSLDNIQYDNLRRDSPKTMPNSYSFVHTSPSRMGTTQVDTIHEQEITEHFSTHYMSTNFSSNTDSGVDSNSFCSMPLAHNETANLVEQQQQPTETGVLSSSSSSPDSQNQNGYETSESQLLVTASEGELSFGYESLNPINVENTIANFNIEAHFESELEQVVLNNLVAQKNYQETLEITYKQLEINEMIEKADDTTTSITTDSSANGSITELDQIEALTPAVHADERTVSDEVTPVVSSYLADYLQEQDEKNSSTAQLMDSSSSSISSISEKEEQEDLPVQVVPAVLENISESEELKFNLISKPIIADVTAAPQMNEAELKTLKFEEEEVNNLVNKIVLDVIAQAIHVSPAKLDIVSDVIEKMTTQAVADSETGQIEIAEVSFNEKDDSVLFKNVNSEECEANKLNSSLEIIEAAEVNNAVPSEIDETNAILNKTEQILSSSAPAAPKDSKKTVVSNQKQPVIDCFSCTIS